LLEQTVVHLFGTDKENPQIHEDPDFEAITPKKNFGLVMQPLKVFTHNEIKTILNLPTWQFYYAIQPVFDNNGRIRLLLGY
jgi:hypothetical protein